MAEPEKRIRRAPRLDRDDIDREQVKWHPQDDIVDLTPYIQAIQARWRSIFSAALAMAAVTAVMTGLLLPKWYRAGAVIRPIATPAVESRIAGVLGGLGGGLGGLGGIAASIGVGSDNDAEEYLAIMRGFQFNLNLATKHHLSAGLLKPGLLSFLTSPGDSNWAIYRALQKRFDCEYSIKTGNITLYFQSRDRPDAERVLGYFINDLRDVLRAREIAAASSAIESLEDEAKTSPDAVLRTELYGLVAKQMQRKKMAQVEADFAFRVLDPPAASDKPYRPSVPLDFILALVLTVVALSITTIASCGRARM